MLKIIFFLLAISMSLTAVCVADNSKNDDDEVFHKPPQKYYNMVMVPEGIITGHVLDSFDYSNTNKTILKVYSNKKIIYLEVFNTKKYDKNKMYEFYPAHSVRRNTKIGKKIIDKIYIVDSTVDPAYKKQSMFHFNNVKLGKSLPDKYNELKSTILSNNKAAEIYYSNETMRIKNYKIGPLVVDVDISSDYFGKVSLLSISYKGSNSSEELDAQVNFMCDILKQKYNLSDFYINRKNIHNEKLKINNYCEWNYGRIIISASYSVDNSGNNIVSGDILDLSRVMQKVNLTYAAINEMALDEASKEIEEEQHKHDKNIADSLKSF